MFEITIARQRDKGEVKLRVRGDVVGGAAILPRRGHPRDVRREPAQEPLGIADERVTHCIRLEQTTEAAQIVDVFRCRRADVGSRLGGDGDQSFLAQLDQGAPDGGLAHAERRGELRFGERLAESEATGNDRVANLICGLSCQGHGLCHPGCCEDAERSLWPTLLQAVGDQYRDTPCLTTDILDCQM